MSRASDRAVIEPPRTLVVAAGAWILLALLLALGTTLPLQITPASLAPAIRITLVTCLVGALVAWPLARLSQGPGSGGVLNDLLQAATLGSLLQLVIWPLRLATPWTVERTLLIDLCALSSLVAVAGIVAVGSRSQRTTPRAIAMVACLVVAGGVRWPLAAAGAQDLALTLPFLGSCATVLELMDATASMPDHEVWTHAQYSAVLSIALGACGCAVAAFMEAAGRRPPARARGVAMQRRVG